MIWPKPSTPANIPASSQITGSLITHLGRALTIVLLLTLTSCLAQSPSSEDSPEAAAPLESPQASENNSELTPPSESSQAQDSFATVTAVEVTAGEPEAYTFVITIESPDTGCDQFANWWEVLDEEGNLIFRRILVHSHVDEQPFSRPGGAVAVQPDQPLLVRAHMYPHGYGTQAMQGTVDTGFEETTLPEGFAADVAQAEPQPVGCEY
ncbi:MAG: hypothetical protein AAF215_23055 [Cyanobacteria bacterium P01_A01_bin.123]